MSKRWRIAVVVQRYGQEVNGGAELEARWLAEQLTNLGEVHVFTPLVGGDVLPQQCHLTPS